MTAAHKTAILCAPRHGHPAPVDPAVWLGPDPELALVTADMDAWHEAHPCQCEALCECPWTQ